LGLDLPAFEFLLKANKCFGDFGNTVILGRQRLLIRNEQENKLFGEMLKRYRPDLSMADISGEYADRLIEALGGEPWSVMDNSAYEGAAVIHDLNEPLPEDLAGRFDTVIDIGTLEHVFNIATAMKSMAEAVRVGGRFLCLNIANNHLGHGFWQFSPEVFFRTFCPMNGYEAVMADLFYQGAFHPLQDPEHAGCRLPIRTPAYTYITFAARRVKSCPIFRGGWPVQADYLAAWTIFQSRSAEAARDIDRAEQILRKAVGEYPDNPLYLASLASLLVRSGGSTAERDALVARAAKMAPDLPAVQAAMGGVGKKPASGHEVSQKKDAAAIGGRRTENGFISLGSLSIKVKDARVPEKTASALACWRYEFKERELARRLLSPGDRVLELGSGMGVVSLTIANLIGVEAISSFEANPAIIDLARENAAANKIPVRFTNAIALPRKTAAQTPVIEFFPLKSFEASSTRRINPSQTSIKVPVKVLEAELDAQRANVLVMDIEGSESDVISNGDLTRVDKLLMEIHPGIIGMKACTDLIDHLESQGLVFRQDLVFGDVLAFQRIKKKGTVKGSEVFASLRQMENLAAEGDTKRALAVGMSLETTLEKNPYFQHRLSQIERVAGIDGLPRAVRAAQLQSGDFALHQDLAAMHAAAGDACAARDSLAKVAELFPQSPAIPILTAAIDAARSKG
jgi:FkbM family methyltransferase